ncbi:serine protease Do [Paenibacillus shirakamiensis]|uniref:Serine protease Do n=1 Tax=Paenibacillus shirakamiensis TaxID=1265935 RepID=A0ABS4JJ57_9BACL|nr:trypsin-like peptidase domain-containing protein [Paenibacillus shirakamiensis]MBP2001740.1 serine protease Do [Paenibacillus shirakamiensis]
MSIQGKAAALLFIGTVLGSSGCFSVSAQGSHQAVPVKSVTATAKPNSKTMSTVKAPVQKNVAPSTVDIIPQIIKKVSPSVVGIIGQTSENDSSTQVKQSTSLYDLAHGTGVILRSDGWIVTNAHVVSGLSNAIVVTSDGKTYGITESYVDEMSDLALIKIVAKSLHPATFAASSKNTVVGETVIALGTPVSFSLRNSATTGIVSGLNRAVNAAYRLIQTDAAINPGNSGGPLLNLKGEVIGINSMKFEAVGVENMGFSIPVETVNYITNQLFKYGEVRRASLGVKLEESWSASMGLPGNDPLTVTNIFSKEAKAAGIVEGDVLYKVNGRRITSVVDLNELLKSFLPGQTVTLWMQSDGDIVTRKLLLSKDQGNIGSEIDDEAPSNDDAV